MCIRDRVSVELWNGYLEDVARHLLGEAEPPYTSTEVKSFGGKLRGLQSEMVRIDARFVALKAEHLAVVAKLTGERDDAIQMLEEAEKAVEAARLETKEVKRLKDEKIETWKRKYNDELDGRREDNTRWRDKMEAAEERLVAQAAQFEDRLASAHREMQEFIVQLAEAKSELRLQVDQHVREIAGKDVEIAELAAQLAGKDDTIRAQALEIAKLHQLLREAQDALERSDFFTERQAHRRSLDEWQRRYAELEGLLVKSKSTEKELTTALVATSKHSDKLERELSVSCNAYNSLSRHLLDRRDSRGEQPGTSHVRPFVQWPPLHEMKGPRTPRP
eukprot:TRINITY_DN29851_c0_g1_i1.p1 TRINITY_DN29851_c0_g1~~TRINITY_DN29851_c0_g1_i1.p1  ORF type:complete len:333 (-),score=120.90 TRINITY_DN29851_c0_g1_i1:338-1336(-)